MSGIEWSRREFLKLGAVAAAIGMVAPAALWGDDAKSPVLKYRVLGRTGLKVTTVALGARYAPEKVIRKAVDLGINWIDAAWDYGYGRVEWTIGRVLKGQRDRAYICTKQPRDKAEKMTRASA